MFLLKVLLVVVVASAGAVPAAAVARTAGQPVEYGLSEPNLDVLFAPGGARLGAYSRIFNQVADPLPAVDGGAGWPGIKWLRLVVPYDLHPGQPLTGDPGTDAPRAANMARLAAFVRTLQTHPRLKGMISFMGHGYATDCVAVHPIAYSAGQPISELPAECGYPESAAVYGQYFNEWLRWNNSLPKPLIRAWAPWNEPDLGGFVFGHMPAEEAAPLLAGYWQEAYAAAQIDGLAHGRVPDVVTAGEMSEYGRLAGLYVDEVVNGPAKPKDWSIHAYDDLLPQPDRTTTLVDFQDRLQQLADAGRISQDFQLWVTEIGAKIFAGTRGGVSKGTGLAGRPDSQYRAGQEIVQLEGQLQHLKVLIYYQLVMGAVNPAFDSAIADAAGLPRPVLCGIQGLARSGCTGVERNPPGPQLDQPLTGRQPFLGG